MIKYDKYKNLFLVLFFTICLLITFGNFFNLGFFSKKKINFGLDLRGGLQLILKIDFDYYLKEKLEENVDLLKDYFLENRIKALPKVEDNNIKIIVKNYSDIKKIEKYLKVLDITFNIKNDKNILFLSFRQNDINNFKKQVNLKTIETIEKRISKLNIKDAIIQTEGDNNILIQVAKTYNLNELKNLIKKTAKLTFHIVDEESNTRSNVLTLTDIRNSYELSVNKKPLLSGDLLANIDIAYNQGKPVINFKFNSIGSKKFAKITKENIGKMLAIVLDDKIVTAPRINGEISGGIGTITGNFSNKEATEIVLLLRTGSLLAPLDIIEEKTIGSTIDKNLIEESIGLFSCGLIFLILFLLIIYKINTIFIIISIFIDMVILMAILSISAINLTLDSIIAIILIIPLSVIINIFIFEKFKQESKIRIENIYNSANIIENTFNSISPIILNLNILVIILTIIFYIFGNINIKNFSIVFIIGIISSLISNLIYLEKILDYYYINKKLLIK